MSSETPAVTPADALAALRRATVGGIDLDRCSEASVTTVGGGINDVFAVSPERSDGRPVVVKFGTYSTAGHLRAGVGAYRLLAASTDLPVPEVYAFDTGDEQLPPFVVMERLPGTGLAEGFRDTANATAPDAVRLLGAVIDAFARIPDRAADGYGFVRGVESRDRGPCAVARYDDWAAWLVEYATRFYEDPPVHDALAAIAPRVPDYLRANRDRLPAAPSPSVVVTDLSPANLLAPDGTPPDGLDEMTGVLDLERAKIGSVEFTALNTEYLLTRYVSDPQPVREALYDPLPFGPDLPVRDLYRVAALGRSVGALDLWYDPGSETYRARGDAIAAELERIVE